VEQLDRFGFQLCRFETAYEDPYLHTINAARVSDHDSTTTGPDQRLRETRRIRARRCEKRLGTAAWTGLLAAFRLAVAVEHV
jgi:hypothetical protein